MGICSQSNGYLLRCVGRAAIAVTLSTISAVAAAQQVPDDFVITMRRWCSADCPIYTVSIDARGNVTYEGHEFARVLGTKTATVEHSAVVALFESVERIGVFKMKDRYRSISLADGSELVVIDAGPEANITVTANGRTKRIEDRFAAPAQLIEFERQVDEVAGTKQWTEVKDPKLPQLTAAGWTASPEDLSVLLKNALQDDDAGELKALIAIGADPNATFSEEKLPALLLVRSAAAARVLLEAGADPRSKSASGVTAFYLATGLEPDITALLLKAGVVADEPLDQDGRTALWQAACLGNAGLVRLLLDAGANPHVRMAGSTAADCARRGKETRRSPTPVQAVSSKRSFVQDFDRTIALLDEALGARKGAR